MILALAGNPNCGKTTLFNALTGANARTGNFPGVTVTRSEGVCRARPEITLVDLPGVYALRLINISPDFRYFIIQGIYIRADAVWQAIILIWSLKVCLRGDTDMTIFR